MPHVATPWPQPRRPPPRARNDRSPAVSPSSLPAPPPLPLLLADPFWGARPYRRLPGDKRAGRARGHAAATHASAASSGRQWSAPSAERGGRSGGLRRAAAGCGAHRRRCSRTHGLLEAEVVLGGICAPPRVGPRPPCFRPPPQSLAPTQILPTGLCCTRRYSHQSHRRWHCWSAKTPTWFDFCPTLVTGATRRPLRSEPARREVSVDVVLLHPQRSMSTRSTREWRLCPQRIQFFPSPNS